MPQRTKGIRLWLQPATKLEAATWVIRDRKQKIRTGCSKEQIAEAERRLADYIVQKHQAPRSRLDPSEVKVADVIALYADDVVPQHARPKDTVARLDRLLDYF